MLGWSLMLLIVALIAGAFGFFHVQWVATEFAWILFVVFLVLTVLSLLLGRRRPPVL
ncbi:MAG: hypothetical protein AMXMBFR64_14540 [Myxococcales bacterium]